MRQRSISLRFLALGVIGSVLVALLGDSESASPPADSLWNSQWNMRNEGLTGGTAGIDIGLLGAWDFTTGSDNVIVAIMRDAAEASHPDFEPAYGARRIVPDQSGSYDDHGTFIAGIIAAEANNGPGTIKRGIAGIDQHCALWNYSNKDSPNPFDQTNADDIDDATNAGVDVMNLSDAEEDEPNGIGIALANAYNRNVVLVAATGNWENNVSRYPASFDGVIGVGGVRG